MLGTKHVCFPFIDVAKVSVFVFWFQCEVTVSLVMGTPKTEAMKRMRWEITLIS